MSKATKSIKRQSITFILFWQVTIEQEHSKIDFGSGNRIIKWVIKTFLIRTGIDFLQHEPLIDLSYGVNKRSFEFQKGRIAVQINKTIQKYDILH